MNIINDDIKQNIKFLMAFCIKIKNEQNVIKAYLADTVVVKETQSFTKVRGVEPVTSSHWALEEPPKSSYQRKKKRFQTIY